MTYRVQYVRLYPKWVTGLSDPDTQARYSPDRLTSSSQRDDRTRGVRIRGFELLT